MSEKIVIKDYMNDEFHKHKGSAMLAASLAAASITALVGLTVSQLVNLEVRGIRLRGDAASAEQYALNAAEKIRTTNYEKLKDSSKHPISGSPFYEAIKVGEEIPADSKTGAPAYKDVIVSMYADGNAELPFMKFHVIRSRDTTSILNNAIKEVAKIPSEYEGVTQKAITDFLKNNNNGRGDNVWRDDAHINGPLGSEKQFIYINKDGTVTPSTLTLGAAGSSSGGHSYIILQNGVFKSVSFNVCTCADFLRTWKSVDFVNGPHRVQDTFNSGKSNQMVQKIDFNRLKMTPNDEAIKNGATAIGIAGIGDVNQYNNYSNYSNYSNVDYSG